MTHSQALLAVHHETNNASPFPVSGVRLATRHERHVTTRHKCVVRVDDSRHTSMLDVHRSTKYEMSQLGINVSYELTTQDIQVC